MKQRCKPPRLDEHDWQQFDFSRWSLDSATRDNVASAIAGLTRQFFESPEWQESVQATMPELQKAALETFKEHAEKLREKRATSVKDFEQRASDAKKRVDAMRRAMAGSDSTQPAPSADAYHLVVRVIGADKTLGLPGVLVQVADPRNASAPPIATATTDVDGNATLTVGPELAKELDKKDTTITALAPSGKVLARVPEGVCVRLNQVETKVLTVKESGESAPLKEEALQTRASREVLLESLTNRAQSLARDRKQKLANLDCKLQDVDALVAELEKPVDLAELVARVKPREPPPEQGDGPTPNGTGPSGPPVGAAPAAPEPEVPVPPTRPRRSTTSSAGKKKKK